MTSARRLNFADMAKGIAILIVVFYHLSAPGIINTVCTHLIPAALLLFFFFSGFFYKPGKRTFQENLEARTKALIIPFFKYSLLFWAVGTIYLLATGDAPFQETLYCLRNFFGGCIWNRTIQGWFQWEYSSLGKRYMFLADFWFLLALFFSSIIFFPIADAVLNSKTKTLLAAGGLLVATGIMRHFAIDLPYNIQLVPFWCAFMLLGAFFGQNRLFEIEELSGTKEWVAAVCALAAGTAIAMVITTSVNLFRGSFAEPEAVNMVLVSVSSLLIIWGLGEVCKLVELAGVRVTELSWLGSHTMTVYLFHVFIAWLISVLTGYPLSYDPAAVTAGTVVKSLLFTCAVLAICIGIDIVRDRLTQKKS